MIYAARYLAGEDSRRKISRQLNKGESMHARQFPRLAATTRPDQALPMTSKSSTECRWTPAADAAGISPRTYPTNPSAAA